MSVKSKLMEEIAIKAQKIRDKRVEAANNKTIEAAVLEFFKNIEESRKLHNNEKYDLTLLHDAKTALAERLHAFDYKVKLSIEWSSSNPDSPMTFDPIRGVTIWWSQQYIKKNNCDQSLYFDVTQILLL